MIKVHRPKAVLTFVLKLRQSARSNRIEWLTSVTAVYVTEVFSVSKAENRPGQ
jgi:hypothetical protein